MTIQTSSPVGSVRSPSRRFRLQFLVAGLCVVAHAHDKPEWDTDSACAYSEVQKHALEQFQIYGPLSANREYFGYIYRYGPAIQSSVMHGSDCRSQSTCGLDTASAARGIPVGGKVLGEWHTHPQRIGAGALSIEDFRGAKHNVHIRCYSAYYAASNGRIFRWNPRSSSVPTAMASRIELGCYWDDWRRAPKSQGMVAGQ